MKRSGASGRRWNTNIQSLTRTHAEPRNGRGARIYIVKLEDSERGKGSEGGLGEPRPCSLFLFPAFFVRHTLQWIFQLGPHQLYAWWNKHWQLLYICKGPYSSCAYLTTRLWIRARPQLGLQREREWDRENERGRIAMGNPPFPPHHVPCSLQQNRNTNVSSGCIH